VQNVPHGIVGNSVDAAASAESLRAGEDRRRVWHRERKLDGLATGVPVADDQPMPDRAVRQGEPATEANAAGRREGHSEADGNSR
jgi:hypothetical protein